VSAEIVVESAMVTSFCGCTRNAASGGASFAKACSIKRGKRVFVIRVLMDEIDRKPAALCHGFPARHLIGNGASKRGELCIGRKRAYDEVTLPTRRQNSPG